MTNSEYWRKRMDAQAGSVYKRCDQFINDLMRQYQTAVRAMEADIAKWYQRFADANGITLAEAGRLLNSDELLEFQWTVEDYIRRGEENAVSGVWMKELESASARVHISRLDSLKMSLRQHVEELIGMQLKTLPEVLHATYRESYDRTVYELSRGSRVMLSYQKPDVRRIDRVLGTPWSSDGKEFSERVWANRAQLIGSMNTHLTQSIIRGEDPQKAINAIAKDMNVSKRRAGTLVMTESAAIATAAQRDCYKDLDVEEFEYVCTLDEVTCPVCGAMDGKHFPMSKYEIGVTVPPMHPNCRCATAPYFDDMDDWGAERAARDENGKTVSVPAEMTYEQWKKEQKKADNAPVDEQLTGKTVPEKYRKRTEAADNSENEVDNSGESGIIEDKEYYAGLNERREERRVRRQEDKSRFDPVSEEYLQTLPRRKNEESASTAAEKTNAKDYEDNCQRCVPAFEMRMRGWDVTAAPAPAGDVLGVDEFRRIFIDVDWVYCTSEAPVMEIKSAVESSPLGARFEIGAHINGNAHVFVAVNEEGVCRFVDPMYGDTDAEHFFTEFYIDKVFYGRIDDRTPSNLIKRCIEVSGND